MPDGIFLNISCFSPKWFFGKKSLCSSIYVLKSVHVSDGHGEVDIDKLPYVKYKIDKCNKSLNQLINGGASHSVRFGPKRARLTLATPGTNQVCFKMSFLIDFCSSNKNLLRTHF